MGLEHPFGGAGGVFWAGFRHLAAVQKTWFGSPWILLERQWRPVGCGVGFGHSWVICQPTGGELGPLSTKSSTTQAESSPCLSYRRLDAAGKQGQNMGYRDKINIPA